MKITLATLSTATAQQVFEQVRDHLLRQGRASYLRVGNSTCAYRSHDGLQCAAGCLIGEAEYVPAMEGRRWDGVIDDGHAPANHAELIGVLQYIHDVYRPHAWEARLRQEAQRRGFAWTISLATLPTASAQEVFEQVANHLLKQNARSLHPERRGCAYRGRDGLSCAAGALLSDADAARLTATQNGHSWDALVSDGVVCETHARLIDRLQMIHDGHEPEDWRLKLRTLALREGLDSSFMDLPLIVYVPVSDGETALA